MFVFPLRTALRDQVRVYVDQVHKLAESTITTNIDYESISPRFFNIVEIQDFSLSRIEGVPGADVTADTVTVRFPLLALIQRGNIALIDIEFTNMKLSADMVEDWQWFELIYRLIFEMPEFDVDLAQVAVDNLELNLQYRDHHIESRIEPFSMSYHFKDQVFACSIGQSQNFLSGPVDGQFDTNGTSRIFSGDGRTTVNIPSLSGNIPEYAAFEDLPLYVAYEDGMLFSSIRTEKTSLLVNYATENNKFQISSSSERFTLDNEISLFMESEIIEILRKIEDLDYSIQLQGMLQEGYSVSNLSYEGEFRLPSFTYDQYELTYLQSTFFGDGDSVDFSRFQGRFQDIPFRFRGDFSFLDRAPTGTLDIRPPGDVLEEVVTLSLERTGKDRTIISYDYKEVSICAELDHSNMQSLPFDAQLTMRDTTYHIPFLLVPEERYISSMDQSDVTFSFDLKPDTANIFLSWDQLHLPVENSYLSQIPFSGRVVGSVSSFDDFNIKVKELKAHDINIQQASPLSISLQANITPDFVNILGLTYQDDYGSVTGKGSLHYNISERTIERGSLRIEEDGESYRFKFDNYQGFYHGILDIDSGHLQRYPFFESEGVFNGTISVFGVSDNLTAEVDLQFPHVEYRGNDYSGTISAVIDSQGISVTDSAISIENIFFEDISGRYDFLDGDFSLSSNLIFYAGENDITTRVRASADLPKLESFWELNQFTSLLEDSLVHVRLQDFMLGELLVSDEMLFDLTFCEETVQIEGGEDGRSFSLLVNHLNRDFHASLVGDLPLQFDAQGIWGEEGKISLYVENVVLDMTFLNYTNIPELEFLSGTATGYLMITGNVQDPDFYGELTADELTANLGYIPETLRVQNVSLTIQEKEMNFAKANIMVGDIPVRSKLDFYIENWFPQYFDMSFTVDKGKHIPSSYTFPGPQFTYDGEISGTLSLAIDPTGTHINGDLLLDNAVVSMITDEYEPPEEPLPVFGDLKITTGRSTQFILPTQEVPILTANVEANQTVNIVFDNLRNTFSLEGNLGLKSGEIFYVRRNFYITEGRIQLSETEQQIDPQISLRARIREYDQQAERVDIYLVVDNQRLSNLNPRFESTPPMSINEIAQILGEGITATDQQGRGGMSQTLAFATAATDIIYQFGLIGQLNFAGDFERTVRNALGVDVFSIRTQVVQNTILGNLRDAGITNPIATTLDNTTVFLGKYFGDSMFFQTMLVLTENRNGESGLFFTDDLNMDMELSFEWETPLYDLKISTQPELDFPGLGLFSDFSIGISWRYSF